MDRTCVIFALAEADLQIVTSVTDEHLDVFLERKYGHLADAVIELFEQATGKESA